MYLKDGSIKHQLNKRQYFTATTYFMLFYLTSVVVIILYIGAAMSFFSEKNTLERMHFMTLPGTVSFIVQVNGQVYFSQRSSPQGSPFVPLSNTIYTEIKKMSSPDFFSGKGNPTTILRLQGAITTGTLSHDSDNIYFIWKRREANGQKYTFCSFNLQTHTVSELGAYDTFGGRLLDIEGKYIFDQGSVYASVTLDKGRSWHDLLGDMRGKRSAFCHDGDAYYMFDNDIFLIQQSEILSKNFKPKKIYSLDADIDVGHLFIADDKQTYISLYGTNPPVLFNIENKKYLPIADSAITESVFTVKAVFNYGNKFYCILGASSAPMSEETKIIMTNGTDVYESELFSHTPDYLGVLEDYLIFNLDNVFKRKSELFGIKYK